MSIYFKASIPGHNLYYHLHSSPSAQIDQTNRPLVFLENIIGKCESSSSHSKETIIENDLSNEIQFLKSELDRFKNVELELEAAKKEIDKFRQALL